MKVKTLKQRLNKTLKHDKANVEVVFDLVEFAYRGVPKELRRLKVNALRLSGKTLTLKASEKQ